MSMCQTGILLRSLKNYPMGVAEVREGEFLILWPQFGNKYSFGDHVNVFVLHWNKAILLSERRMKTVGHHWQEGALAVLAQPLGEQSGAGWAQGGAEGDAALLHASGPSATAMRGCGGRECRVPSSMWSCLQRWRRHRLRMSLEWERGDCTWRD